MRVTPPGILSLVMTLGLTGVAGAPVAEAKLMQAKRSLDAAFSPIPYVSPANIKAAQIADADSRLVVAEFCAELKIQFKKFGWGEEPCEGVTWRADLRTRGNRPLLFAEFGTGKATTLVLGGVHPDELTPVPIGFRIARHLSQHPDAIGKDVRVIVAPLVNPDGFLKDAPTRTNGSGVDLNRNFFTFDWYQKAKKYWQDLRERSPKHFPGYVPNSEVETIFQIQLIDDFRPDKILSVHAPLGFLDYDGPGDQKITRLSPTQEQARRLVTSISEKSDNYKVVDYNFFPGSLGNYAGNERHIPTVTLELETTDPKMVESYWKQFLPGIMQSIHYPFSLTPEQIDTRDAPPFSAVYGRMKKRTI